MDGVSDSYEVRLRIVLNAAHPWRHRKKYAARVIGCEADNKVLRLQESLTSREVEHQRLAEAVQKYLDAIGCEESGDMPEILDRLASEAAIPRSER